MEPFYRFCLARSWEKMAKNPEELLRDKVIDYLRKNRIFHFVYFANTTFGLPDIIAIYKGFFVGIELKREDGKGKPSSLQIETVRTINEAGGYAEIIESLEELESMLGAIDNVRV